MITYFLHNNDDILHGCVGYSQLFLVELGDMAI